MQKTQCVIAVYMLHALASGQHAFNVACDLRPYAYDESGI